MAENDIPPEVSAYMAKIGRKGGIKGIAVVNAKLTTAKRRRAGKKAMAAQKLTPEERSERARKAAAERWRKQREEQKKTWADEK